MQCAVVYKGPLGTITRTRESGNTGRVFQQTMPGEGNNSGVCWCSAFGFGPHLLRAGELSAAGLAAELPSGVVLLLGASRLAACERHARDEVQQAKRIYKEAGPGADARSPAFDAGGGVDPTPDNLHPTPYTPHPTTYTLHPTPYTLHPTPDTLHPTPYTLHPTLFTLHPKP